MISKHGNLFIYSILTAINVSVLLGIFFINENVAAALTKESGLVESVGVFFFILALFFLVRISLKRKKKILPIIWILLCVFFIGEETSWFQHYFHYEVPAVEKINAQSEFNIHNLEIFQGGKLAEPEVKLTDVLLKSQNLFRMGFFGYFLVLPSLYIIPWVKSLLERTDFRKPDKLFRISLIIVFTISFLLAYEATPYTKRALAETREMLYAFYIFLYVVVFIRPKNKLI